MGSGMGLRGARQLSVQVRLGHLQLAVHGYIGDMQRSRCLLIGEAAEEDEVDDLSLARVPLGKQLQSIVELNDIRAKSPGRS